jgi:hypothetical protein
MTPDLQALCTTAKRGLMTLTMLPPAEPTWSVDQLQLRHPLRCDWPEHLADTTVAVSLCWPARAIDFTAKFQFQFQFKLFYFSCD